MPHQPLAPQENESEPQDRKEYQAPQVRDMGTVKDLTQSDPQGVPSDFPATIFTSAT